MKSIRGATLIELIVVLVIVAMVAGITGASLAGLRNPREPTWAGKLRQTRSEAARIGRAVATRARGVRVVFLPDGRALGPIVDPLTGRPVAAPQ